VPEPAELALLIANLKKGRNCYFSPIAAGHSRLDIGTILTFDEFDGKTAMETPGHAAYDRSNRKDCTERRNRIGFKRRP